MPPEINRGESTFMGTFFRTSFGWFLALPLFLVLASGEPADDSNNSPETACSWVSVSDAFNRYVTGLKKDNFRIYEDNVEQTISSFSQQAVPMNVGIIWDVSRSRHEEESLAQANSVIRALGLSGIPQDSRNAEDEYFLVNFSESAPIQSFSAKARPARVQIDNSKKRIALYDAVYMGLVQILIKQSYTGKRALIIISDGAETYSKHKPSEILSYAKKFDVQIYYITIAEKQFPSAIRNAVEITGGRAFFPQRFNDLDYYIDLVLNGLRNQYRLCYTPVSQKRDGKRRKLKIKLDRLQDLPKLMIRTRTERYVPKN